MAQDAICSHLSFTLFQTQKSIFSLICLWHKRASKQDSLTKGSLTKRLVEKAHSPQDSQGAILTKKSTGTQPALLKNNRYNLLIPFLPLRRETMLHG